MDNDTITDNGIKYLTNLTFLNLNNNYNITDAGIRNLSEGFWLRRTSEGSPLDFISNIYKYVRDIKHIK